MRKSKNGGPAFPQPDMQENGECVIQGSPGMSLRDYFAAAALSGNLEQGIRDNMDCSWWRKPSECAQRAYAIADAMLAARDARP